MLTIREFQQLPPTERMMEIYSVLCEMKENRRPTDEELREFALFYIIKEAKDKGNQGALKRERRNFIDPELIKLPQYYKHDERKKMRKYMQNVYDKFSQSEKHVQDELGDLIQFLKSFA